jgi:hypothetical protein
VSVDNDRNEDIGLSSLDPASTKLSLSGNTLTVIDPDGPESGTADFDRVTGANAIVGAWFTGDVAVAGNANDSAVAVFLANGSYFLARDGVDGAEDEIEHGTYQWTPGTGAFAFTASFIDQYADGGLYAESGPGLITSFTVSGNVLTGIDGYGDFTLNSVSAIPEPSTYAALAGLGALGLAFWRRRRAQAA